MDPISQMGALRLGKSESCPNAHWEEGQARIQTKDPCALSCLSVKIYFSITKDISVKTLRMAIGLRSEEQMGRKTSGIMKEAQDHLNLEWSLSF